MTIATLSLIVPGFAIALLIFGNRLRGHRLRRLDHWTREFYKTMDEALACEDAWRVVDVLELMNECVANALSAIAWVIVFSKPKKREQGNPDLLQASPKLREATGRCVIAGIMAISYHMPVVGFVLRALMAETIAEPPRAIELAGKSDLRSRIRHPVHAVV
jgi:hypothetical protein